MTPREDVLQGLQDREELRDLIGRYARSIDDRDIDSLMECFDTEGTFTSSRSPHIARKGEALRTFYEDILSTYGMSIHIPHWQVIDELDRDVACGWVLARAEFAMGERFIVTMLRYEDRYRRVDGRWLIEARVVNFWYFVDLVDLPEAVVSGRRVVDGDRTIRADLPESLGSYQSFLKRKEARR